MDFVSFTYFAFLLIVFCLYYSLPHRWQNRMLLLASCFFYGAWDPRFLLLIFISITTDFFCGQRIHESPFQKHKRLWLGLSLLVNLGILCYFKYFGFFVDNFIALVASFGIDLHRPTLDIILPVGISFYTFQTLCYTIDIYRKQFKPVRNYLDYALYVSFFPQLLAGPIERAANLLPQIQKPRTLDRDRLKEGFFLLYWGYFKKVFIADNINVLIRMMASDEKLAGTQPDGLLILISTYAFMFQLYADFSAYSDIARGTAKLMGFDIMVNFRAPFFSKNIQEMPKRWHISLTSWVLDYIYYPLAFNRWKGKHLNVHLVTILTFLVMGFWHGPSWNYIIWGGYYGVLLALYSIWTKRTKKYRRPVSKGVRYFLNGLSVFITFHFTVLGFLFFRAPDLSAMLRMIEELFLYFSYSAPAMEMAGKLFLFCLPLLIMDGIQYWREEVLWLYRFPVWLRWAFLYITFYLMVVHAPRVAAFVYFQF